MIKKHIPKPGYSTGLSGLALCGHYAEYGTGDHGLIRDNARRDPDGEVYCKRCLALLEVY